jgi:hypothetical protein
VVATARKLTVLCWHLVVKEQDYAFARPSLTAQKLRALELQAGMPARRGQKGKAAAYSLNQVRRHERELTEQAERAYRQLIANWQSKRPGTDAAREWAWSPPQGRDSQALNGAKLRGRACSPGTLLFAPGSTTPDPEPTSCPESRKDAARSLTLSSVVRQWMR